MQPVQKSAEATQQQKETAEVKGQSGQKKKTKKLVKEKSEADLQLENR